MADILTPQERSKLMAKIKNKDTSIELKVRKWLFSKGFRYRVNVKKLPGAPDIVLKKYNCAIFINGCFWHGHGCKDGHLPKSNTEFWGKKIGLNKARDMKNLELLQEQGWRVITIWECELCEFEKRMSLLMDEITCSFMG